MSRSLTLDSPILSLKNWLNPNLHRFSHRTSRFHSKTKVSCQIFPLHSSLPASGSGCEWRCETCPLAARPRGEISDQTQIPDESNIPYIWVNYNDLTATSLEYWLVRGNIPIWFYFNLVNYCNLPKYIPNIPLNSIIFFNIYYDIILCYNILLNQSIFYQSSGRPNNLNKYKLNIYYIIIWKNNQYIF